MREGRDGHRACRVTPQVPFAGPVFSLRCGSPGEIVGEREREKKRTEATSSGPLNEEIARLTSRHEAAQRSRP